MAFYVYVLKCWNNSPHEFTFYTGYTSRTPSQRLEEHKRYYENKENHFTAQFKYHELVYFERHAERDKAMMREKEIKKKGKEYRQGLIDGMRYTYKHNFKKDWQKISPYVEGVASVLGVVGLALAKKKIPFLKNVKMPGNKF